MSKKKKKNGILKKNFFVFLLCFMLIVGLVYYILKMPVHNIYIKNNNIVSDDEIIELAGLENYPSFLLTRSSDIKKNIKKSPYIETVDVKKEFGNIVSISVWEYRFIALTRDDKLILSNGLQIDNVYELSDIPVLINEIGNQNVYKNFSKKFGKVDMNILRQISEIEYSPVEVDEDRFLLYMNDGNLVYITLTKIGKLNKYNSIRDKLGDKKGIIYLDAGDYVELR